MNAPKLVESIPAVSAPVQLSEVRESRARFLAGVITGAALIVVDVVGFVFYFAAGLAS